MNLRDLQYIIAVAELKNFTAAANACSISQPTLSTQIKKLEDYLDIQIFTRESNQVEVTEIGRKIVDIAKRINEEANQIKSLAKFASEPKVNNITLGAFPTLANYVFPEYVFRLKQHYEGIKIRLIEEKTDGLVNLLVQSKIDLALLAMPVKDDALEGIPLFEDQFFVAVFEDHPLANKDEVELEELLNEQLLLLDEGHCLRTQILKLCSFANLHEDDFRAASLETLRVMVKNGLGITLMPSVAVLNGESDIKYVPIKSNPYRTIGLYWNRRNHRADFFRELARLLSYKPIQ